MQARVCVQNFENGDVQGFLFIDEGAGSGEALITTSARYAAGSPPARSFMISGTSTNSTVTANCEVDVDSRSVDFTLNFAGSSSPSVFTKSLAVSTADCQ